MVIIMRVEWNMIKNKIILIICVRVIARGRTKIKLKPDCQYLVVDRGEGTIEVFFD